ncbi:hypothetical protein E8E13_009954 [Curvularia kusanoi]|uniref:Uncharacterized protein n=1 Tax=Curvularia kusanoi TaxID=90978 RepID=A0A9P4TNU9_CURKU|nr:hypothetical protein E8E13_009954 [Curvularia kusanoi]
MKSFTIGAVVLAAGVSAQYSAAVPSYAASSPAASVPAYSASKPAVSSPAASSPAASKPAASTPAPSGPSVTTTITAKAGCPTGPAPDVIVTRSNVAVPSCAAGSNSTKPSIVSMPGYGPPPAGASGTGSAGAGAGGKGNATMTGMPPQFTGAAGKTAVSGVLALVAGLAAWAL